MKHRHHIIPLHDGGEDIESNLIVLTVEEHADAHKILWEKNGKWQDYLAWQGLAGMISHKELIQELIKLGAKKGAAVSNSKRKGMKYRKRTEFNKPKGTIGMLWYHNPNDPSQKTCVTMGNQPPDGWVRGQGKKKTNPGLNFHKH